LLQLDKGADLGLSVSPDGRYLLFSKLDYSGGDLMLVENFRWQNLWHASAHAIPDPRRDPDGDVCHGDADVLRSLRAD
jgi:hypothetical protein